MARITVVLDELIDFSQKEQTGEPKPAKAAALCELAGAGGVAFHLNQDSLTRTYDRLVRSIKDVLGIPLALIIPAHEKTIEKTIELKPDIAVLTDFIPGDNDFIARLQVAGIIAGIETAPDIDRVKAAAKAKADYVALNTTDFCREKSLSLRVDMLNKIAKAAALAERLTMGVIATGPLTTADLSKLSCIEQVEDVFIGHELLSRAMLFGLSPALDLFKKEVSGY